jgi:hypothetical protein
MRQGEALAGSQNDFHLDGEVPQAYVHRQLRSPRLDMDGKINKGTLAVPKSKKRFTYIYAEGLTAIRDWLGIYKDFSLKQY